MNMMNALMNFNPKRTAAGLLTLMIMMTVGFTGCTDAPTANEDFNSKNFQISVIETDPIDQQEASEVRQNVRKNQNDTIAVEPEETVVVIRNRYPNAEILGIELDYDREDLNYEVIVRREGKVYVIVIDPETGEITEEREIEEHFYLTTITVVNNITVKVEDACNEAREESDGDVVEVVLEEVDGAPTYIIIILTERNTYVTVYVDAKSGKKKKIKDEKCEKKKKKYDDDDDDDDDDDKCKKHKHKKKKGRGHYRHGNGHGYGHHYHCHCACDCDDDDDEENGGGTLVDSIQVIGADSARNLIAENFATDTANVSAPVAEARIENGDTIAYYDAVVEIDSNRYEVRLNARNGDLVEVTQTAGDLESGEYTPPTVDNGATTLVPLSTARTAALAEVPGTVMGWTLAYDATAAAWLYTFRIEETGTTTEKKVRVDASTGVYLDTI